VGGSKAAQIGFHLQSVLAVRWPTVPDTPAPRRPGVEILGLADQQYHVRQPRPAEQVRNGSERRGRAAADLEAALWERASHRLGPAPERDDVQWVKVCDRAGDISDHLRHCQHQRQHFVSRATQDRVVVTAQGHRAGKLFASACSSASLGEVAVEVRARPGQRARTARLQLSVTPLLVRAPQVARQGPGMRPPVACTVVRVWEVIPPSGTNPLEWLLLTDLPAATFAQACEIAQRYATRWLEEVCQSQPVKMPWRPLRLLTATMISLRGGVKREHVRDVDLLPRDDYFLDQALGNRLAIGKGEALQVLA
jgi:hypothetical protein